ncbi:MAG: hypothetical protein HKN77_09250 [Woeseiaceae bacterium]|nr:hypothetical protein [Woeseiaceae bacterium]
MTDPIPTKIISNVCVAGKSDRRVGKDFRRLLADGHTLRVHGQGKRDPMGLLSDGYTPKHEIELFGTRFFLCNLRDAHHLKVFPAFVMPKGVPGHGKPQIHGRVFYKDSSLVWRSASHYINTPDEQWIGKGAIRWQNKKGARGWYSVEETTNLPFEMQAALDDASRRSPKSRRDERVLFLFLRNAPSDRVWPYYDFEAPRERAMRIAANRINNNKPIARFEKHDDPRSLKFVPGFEPDFRSPIDESQSRSTMYGGDIRKIRIASRNRKIQYLFVQGPNHVWLISPQSFTTELSSYGLRTIDVVADEDLGIPGYEFFDNRGDGEVDDQIPAGFAGPVCPYDPDRADASPWNHRMPVVQAFRRSKVGRRFQRLR